MNRVYQRGVALVITLIMLSVVTFMAITFLALSRRERFSVSVTADQTTASLMADAALARAQAQVMARILSRTNLFAYELMVSTNFINTNGFRPQQFSTPNPTNVNYDYRADGRPFTDADRFQNIANLQFNPRAPVYVDNSTVDPGAAGYRPSQDFRFYWDFNRNGLFEPNGWLGVTNHLGLPTGEIGLFVGDPEFIGVLERPEYPHSASNRFIGRYAFIVLPAGKSLDFNNMHDHAKTTNFPAFDYFLRNQGVGSWEINGGGFLRDLNTNEWPYYAYNNNILQQNQKTTLAGGVDAMAEANNIYTNTTGPLAQMASAQYSFGAVGRNAFLGDYIDDYSHGPLMSNTLPLLVDTDVPTRAWPGSDKARQFLDVQELFGIPTTYPNFAARLSGTWGTNTANTLPRNTVRSSYDRYTFYRLLAQMGVDSTPATSNMFLFRTTSGFTLLPGNKLHINYRNDAGLSPTNFVQWTPLGFFTNAADRLLRTQLGLSITNIPIYPTNFYSSAVHQLLQVAANINDATTNRTHLTGYPYLPSVYRPVFTNNNGLVSINGYVEVTNSAFFVNRWLDLNVLADRSAINGLRSNANVYGVPLVIAAKPGFPNFNEFALQNAVQVSRKLEVRKDPRTLLPIQTNQLFVVGVSNAFGLEAWNSYKTTYPRTLELFANNQFSITLTNLGQARPVAIYSNYAGFSSNIVGGTWTGKSFVVPLNTNIVFLTNAAYMVNPPRFVPFNTNYLFDPTPGFPTPQWGLTITNRLQFMIVDRVTQRVVDFVNLNNMGAQIDVTAALIGNQTIANEASSVGAFWQTNRLSAGGVPSGVRQQILESLGQTTNGGSLWTDYNADPVAGQTKSKAIDLFRVYLGLAPYHYRQQDLKQELGNSISHQAPFTPTRKIYQNISWQANDPLVHYVVQDLQDLTFTNNIQYAIPPTTGVPTNSNLGQLNRRYRPWGGNPNVSSDINDFNLAVKDPMVRSSDDWNFPTNKFPNIGWLGRVHRGTPWQTVYLKSPVEDPTRWMMWSGNYFTHPTNDWRILELFTVAPNDNAARGLLSVNQTNLAAWSAVLSGASVLTNSLANSSPPTNTTELLIQPSSPQLYQIVNDINQTRALRPGGEFSYLGEVLATPSLTTNSPFLGPLRANVPDEVYERIPQQVLSLLKEDEPRVVVYAYGQSLAPVGPPVLAPGKPYDGMCTNYQVTGEVLTKSVLRIYGTPLNARVIRERFQSLPNE
jgi:hypothetical protein